MGYTRDMIQQITLKKDKKKKIKRVLPEYTLQKMKNAFWEYDQGNKGC